MKPEDFGKLVQSLRKEYRDDNDNLLTQETLAKRTGLPLRTIERIESGTLKRLEAGTLLQLADALRLTSMERKEFFYAAIGIEKDQQSAPARSNPAPILEELIERIGAMDVPAFINDVYGDILAANRAIIELLGISNQYISASATEPAGFNNMKIVFSAKSHFRSITGSQWDSSVLRIMQFFRALSLRYRFEPYFEQTLRVLQTLPDFKEYWKQAHLEDEGILDTTTRYSYRHPIFGAVDYSSNVAMTVTNAGELCTVVYLPLSENTRNAFATIIKNHGKKVVRLSSWPEKTLTYSQPPAPR